MKTLFASLALAALLGVAPAASADCLDYFVPTQPHFHACPIDGCAPQPCFVMVGEKDCYGDSYDTCHG